MNRAGEGNDVNHLYFILRSLHIVDGDILIPLRMLGEFTDARAYYWSDQPDQALNGVTIYLVRNGMIPLCYI